MQFFVFLSDLFEINSNFLVSLLSWEKVPWGVLASNFSSLQFESWSSIKKLIVLLFSESNCHNITLLYVCGKVMGFCEQILTVVAKNVNFLTQTLLCSIISCLIFHIFCKYIYRVETDWQWLEHNNNIFSA